MTIHIGCPGGHIPLSTPEDVKEFLSQTNGMHDAYLLSARQPSYRRGFDRGRELGVTLSGYVDV